LRWHRTWGSVFPAQYVIVAAMTLSRLCRILLFLPLAATPLHAQSSAVLPTAVALPATYTGNCPAKIEFVGHLTVTVPGAVIEFRWERSNGDSGKVIRATVGAGRTVDSASHTLTVPVPSDVWHVGQAGRTGQFWEVLHVLAPVDIRSAPARVTLDCRD
jgi:hypothetical protein